MIFYTIVNMSIISIAVFAVIIAVRILMKKLPAKYSYYMWFAFLFRLICPFSFSTSISIFNFIDTLKKKVMNNAISDVLTQAGTSGNTGFDDTQRVMSGLSSDNASSTPVQIFIKYGTMIWLVGIAAIIIYNIVVCLKLRSKLRDAVLLKDNIMISKTTDTPFVYGIIHPPDLYP